MAADYETLQQCPALAWRTAALGGEVVKVVPQVLPVRQKLVVADIGRVGGGDDNIPFLQRLPSLDGHRRIAWANDLLAPAIDEHAGIDGAGQHLLNHLVGGTNPDDAASLGAVLHQARHSEARH